jgi:hypothetical protein
MTKKLTNMEYERRDPQLLGALENQCKGRNKRAKEKWIVLYLKSMFSKCKRKREENTPCPYERNIF